MKKTLKLAPVAVAAVFLVACGGGESGLAPFSNTAPLANAGQLQNVLVGATVTLNGSNSSDANSDKLTYSWTMTSKPAGSAAVLTGEATAMPTFIADVAGTYVASLVVNDGKENSAVATVNVIVDDNTVFAKDASALLEDPRAYYTCTEALFQNMMDTIDMNGDGKLDLVAHYWCNQWNKTVSFREPTPNSLVVYLSQPNGGYKIANESVFGAKIVRLSGASRKSRVADFNNDGYMDIFYAMNSEDGRPVSEDNTNQYAKASFIISNGKGGYQVDMLDPANWYHGIDIAANAEGGYDAVANGIGHGPTVAFRNVNNSWKLVSGYPRVSLTHSFVNPKNGETSLMVTGGLQSAAQLQLFKKTNDVWSEASSVLFESKEIPFTSWQNSDTNVTTITLNGNDIVAAGFDETCITRLSPDGNPFVIARMSGYMIEGGYKPSMGRIKEGSTPAYQSLLTYEIVDDQLIRRDGIIAGEDTSVAFNKYQCRDLNGDGLMDVIGHPLTNKGQPILYMNDGKGKLVSRPMSDFPIAPACFRNATTRMADLNADGYEDLIIFRVEPTAGDCDTPPIIIYYGKKNL